METKKIFINRIVGFNRPTSIMDIVSSRRAIGKKTHLQLLPLEQGGLILTWTDMTKAKALLNLIPNTSLACGLETFVNLVSLLEILRKMQLRLRRSESLESDSHFEFHTWDRLKDSLLFGFEKR